MTATESGLGLENTISNLLAALEGLEKVWGCFCDEGRKIILNPKPPIHHSKSCKAAQAAVAKAKGEK